MLHSSTGLTISVYFLVPGQKISHKQYSRHEKLSIISLTKNLKFIKHPEVAIVDWRFSFPRQSLSVKEDSEPQTVGLISQIKIDHVLIFSRSTFDIG